MADDDTNEKQLFALAWLTYPEDPYKAALEVVGDDLARGLVMSREWPQDPEVNEYKTRAVKEKGENALVPSKAGVVRAMWRVAKECELSDPETALKGFKMVADTMGYIEKPGTTVNNNTLVDQRKVMIVTDHGTDDQWEAKLLKQQAELTHGGARSAVN